MSSPDELPLYIERQRESNWPDLPTKERAFAHEYIIEYRHRDAAKQSGFSPDNGARLLRKPLVAAYIAYLQEMQLTSNIITKDFINAQYLRLYDMATGLEEQQLVTADGDEYKAKKTELGTAVNIVKEMSKSTEYEKDTGNKTAAVQVNIDFGGLRGSDSRGTPNVTIEGELDE